jgi:hypothetical protein
VLTVFNPVQIRDFRPTAICWRENLRLQFLNTCTNTHSVADTAPKPAGLPSSKPKITKIHNGIFGTGYRSSDRMSYYESQESNFANNQRGSPNYRFAQVSSTGYLRHWTYHIKSSALWKFHWNDQLLAQVTLKFQSTEKKQLLQCAVNVTGVEPSTYAFKDFRNTMLQYGHWFRLIQVHCEIHSCI